jgi:hypothetical protein
LWEKADLPKECPKELLDAVRIYVPLLSGMLRDLRNRGGHPASLPEPTKEEMTTHLVLLPTLVAKVRLVVEWLRSDNYLKLKEST